jgi:hypothetical protein
LFFCLSFVLLVQLCKLIKILLIPKYKIS